MKRILTSFAIMALAALSPLFAQTQTDFRTTASGIWSDSQIWEENSGGIWLKPDGDIYPGDSHDRNVNVTVDDGSTVFIGKDQTVEINSLAIMNGRVVVEGMLIIGPSKNDPDFSSNNATTDNPFLSPTQQNPIVTDAPQLLQNVPNPLAPQFGYETTIKFYLDRQYANARLTIYDQLAHVVQRIYQEENPVTGWHEVKVRLERIQSGSYPLLLELPNTILRRMIMVVR